MFSAPRTDGQVPGRPIFVVGMPRSGTKLLRAMLNQHPSVAIPEVETEFLPYWINNWSVFGDLSDPATFRKFYESCSGLPFFSYIREAGEDVSLDDWYRRCADFTPGAVFEALIKSHLRLSDTDDVSWGDKSPSYITHLMTLQDVYPTARFLHIIRDVRDYCVSINAAWSKNIHRAAQRWSDDVSVARAQGHRLDGRYTEIRYEDLLADPESTLRDVCRFLEIPFEKNLLELSRETENLGRAKGSVGIVRNNSRKYLQALSPGQIQRIEQIAGRTLRDCGYSCDYDGDPIRVPDWSMRAYQIIDSINLLLFSLRGRGISGAFRFLLGYFRITGNRQKAR